MNAPDASPSSPGQQWPCGPDCIFARPQTGTNGDWIWCDRPAASERLRHAGSECLNFRSTGGLPGTLEDNNGFSPSPMKHDQL